MHVIVGRQYHTADGQLARVLSEVPGTPDTVIGVVGHLNRPMTWLVNGTTIVGSGFDYLVSEVIPGRDIWAGMDTLTRDTVKRIVFAFIDKKITGIKLLRANYNWGLAEAKNIFEGVADRSML